MAGKLVAFPTETVYGLGADATPDDSAVARVYAAKGRPAFNPLIVHVAELADAASNLPHFPDGARARQNFLAGTADPGCAAARSCPVSLLASAGLPSLAIRVPSHPMAQALLRAAAGRSWRRAPILSGRISPTTADHVRAGTWRQSRASSSMAGAVTVGLELTIVGFLR